MTVGKHTAFTEKATVVNEVVYLYVKIAIRGRRSVSGIPGSDVL